jgi:hypothetical protein
MRKLEKQAPKRSLMKGMLAGLVGGLAAVVVKTAGQTTIDKTSGMAAHLVYGVVTETVRRFVRKRLG